MHSRLSRPVKKARRRRGGRKKASRFDTEPMAVEPLVREAPERSQVREDLGAEEAAAGGSQVREDLGPQGDAVGSPERGEKRKQDCPHGMFLWRKLSLLTSVLVPRDREDPWGTLVELFADLSLCC